MDNWGWETKRTGTRLQKYFFKNYEGGRQEFEASRVVNADAWLSEGITKVETLLSFVRNGCQKDIGYNTWKP